MGFKEQLEAANAGTKTPRWPWVICFSPETESSETGWKRRDGFPCRGTGQRRSHVQSRLYENTRRRRTLRTRRRLRTLQKVREAGYARAMFNLADLYSDGLGTVQDWDWHAIGIGSGNGVDSRMLPSRSHIRNGKGNRNRL